MIPLLSVYMQYALSLLLLVKGDTLKFNMWLLLVKGDTLKFNMWLLLVKGDTFVIHISYV